MGGSSVVAATIINAACILGAGMGAARLVPPGVVRAGVVRVVRPVVVHCSTRGGRAIVTRSTRFTQASSFEAALDEAGLDWARGRHSRRNRRICSAGRDR